jgi:hypothetical protein
LVVSVLAVFATSTNSTPEPPGRAVPVTAPLPVPQLLTAEQELVLSSVLFQLVPEVQLPQPVSALALGAEVTPVPAPQVSTPVQA